MFPLRAYLWCSHGFLCFGFTAASPSLTGRIIEPKRVVANTVPDARAQQRTSHWMEAEEPLVLVNWTLGNVANVSKRSLSALFFGCTYAIPLAAIPTCADIALVHLLDQKS